MNAVSVERPSVHHGYLIETLPGDENAKGIAIKKMKLKRCERVARKCTDLRGHLFIERDITNIFTLSDILNERAELLDLPIELALERIGRR
jgi:hypothetical protein